MPRPPPSATLAYMARAADRGDDELITTINVTPLVDIVLVLLIVLLVAVAYVVTNAIPLDLPPGAPNESATPPQIVIAIDATDRMRLDGEPVTERQLRERASAFALREPRGRAVLVADPASTHGAFVRAIDTLRQAGVRRYAVSDASAEPR